MNNYAAHRRMTSDLKFETNLYCITNQVNIGGRGGGGVTGQPN